MTTRRLAGLLVWGLTFAAFADSLAFGQDPDLLSVQCDSVIQEAVRISKSDILSSRTVKGGGVGFRPGGAYDGIWLSDCTFLLEAYRYWGPGYRDFLYSEKSGARGIAFQFSGAQDTDGLIPMVFWGDTGKVDYGGRYDLARNRKQNRDMESPYTFVHVNSIYWKDTGDLSFIRRLRTSLRRALEPIDRRRDADTGLILATYGPPNSDVSVDFAVPQTTAHPYFNALYVRAYLEYAEMAEALGDGDEAKVFRDKARALREAINRHLWIPSRRRYETCILRTPVSTDAELPATQINQDTRFPVVDNMLLIYYGIPDTRRKIEALLDEIEASEKGLAVAGQMVEPPYPDGFISRAAGLFDGGNYHNGDVWTWFSNRHVISLYRLGYPEAAKRALLAQARLAVRDKGFSEFYEDDAEGKAKGAFHYSPTAATFQLAVIEGLFGLELDAPRRTLRIAPSLTQSGGLKVRLGGKPAELSMEINAQRGQMLLRIDADFRGKGKFRPLIPKDLDGQGKWAVVWKADGGEKAVRSTLVREGDASYLEFVTELVPGARAFLLQRE